MFYLEVLGHVPLVRAFCGLLASRLETQMALVNLLCNLTMAVLVMPLLKPIQRMLEHFWPASDEEDFAKLKYLNPQALDDPDTAIDLVEKEQTRLVARLPDYVNTLRMPEPGARRIDVRAVHEAFGLLFRDVNGYQTRMIQLHLAPATSERLTNVHNRHEIIAALEDSVWQLVSAVEQSPPSPQLAPLLRNITEALDFLVVSASEAVTGLDPDEAAMLSNLCADRGELMGKIRSLYLSSDHSLAAADKSLLLTLTTLFDRIVWTVRRLAKLLQENFRFRG
jgi:phosphate:Na+ symporter